MKLIFIGIAWLFFIVECESQISVDQVTHDSTLNNLVLPTGYKTSEYGAVPNYLKAGRGKPTLLLIHGWGFDNSVFADFISANKSRYKMIAINIPGFGSTSASSMPAEGSSYGEQIWSKGAIEGIAKLIRKEKLEKPVIVGHFTLGVQLALKLAIEYPDLVGGAILIGGPAKFIPFIQGKMIDYTPEQRIKVINMISPKYYKTIRKNVFDENNYLAELYSSQKGLAHELWLRPTTAKLPIMVQYLLEFFASDLTLEMEKLKVPVLVICPGFNEDLLNQPENPTVNYIKPQFIDGWEKFKEKNNKMVIKDVPNAGVFIWKDQPEQLYSLIREFTKLK